MTTPSERPLKIYIACSWKQRDRVRALAMALRRAGHDVYDFTDPACRDVPEIPPERFPEQFDPERGSYADYLRAVPEWADAVMCNRRALRRCDVAVLLLPCGADSHADWAFAVGAGKWTAVVCTQREGERTPSHLWADALLADDSAVAPWVAWLTDVGVDRRAHR